MAKQRGRGVAAVNYPTGMNLGGDPTQALVHSTPTGNFIVSLSSVDLGQGIKSVVAQICAETLGVPTERVIVDTGHKTPTPDGLYAIRDTFECIVVKRLQVLRSSRPTRVKVISDNPNHPSEEAPLGDLEIVGKVLCCLKLF